MARRSNLIGRLFTFDIRRELLWPRVVFVVIIASLLLAIIYPAFVRPSYIKQVSSGSRMSRSHSRSSRCCFDCSSSSSCCGRKNGDVVVVVVVMIIPQFYLFKQNGERTRVIAGLGSGMTSYV